MAATSRTGVVMVRRSSSWIAGDLIRSPPPRRACPAVLSPAASLIACVAGTRRTEHSEEERLVQRRIRRHRDRQRSRRLRGGRPRRPDGPAHRRAWSAIPAGLGGTCLLRGCIPTKALLHTADLYEEIKHAQGLRHRGRNAEPRLHRGDEPQDAHRDPAQQGDRGLPLQEEQDHPLQGPGAGWKARATSSSRAKAARPKIKTKNVLLATGSRPRSLPGLAFDGKTIITSDEILELKSDAPQPGGHRRRRGGHRVRVRLRALRRRR